MLYDFHTHTFLSDGVLSPIELIRRAIVNGYTALGIADHVGPSTLVRFVDEVNDADTSVRVKSISLNPEIPEGAFQQVPSRIKLKLLENEENMFDSGLYVGLGGTVASLVFLAMGIAAGLAWAALDRAFLGMLREDPEAPLRVLRSLSEWLHRLLDRLARELARDLGYPHFAVGHNVTLRKGRYGNATLSRWPIVRERNIDLTVEALKRRGCQHTTIVVLDGTRHDFRSARGPIVHQNNHRGINSVSTWFRRE